jgi:hypothetical protein
MRSGNPSTQLLLCSVHSKVFVLRNFRLLFCLVHNQCTSYIIINHVIDINISVHSSSLLLVLVLLPPLPLLPLSLSSPSAQLTLLEFLASVNVRCATSVSLTCAAFASLHAFHSATHAVQQQRCLSMS